MPPRFTRRSTLLAGLGAAACASDGPRTGAPADAIFRNLATPSESVHCGVASEDGTRRVTVRLCRYPDLGLAWVWVHARTPRGFFSYVDHLAPCERAPAPETPESVSYADKAGTLRFEREGPAARPVRARITGRCMARRTADAPLGRGDHALDVSIDFTPARLRAGLLEGRSEVFGRAHAQVSVDGERVDIAGPAQFHEQRQATARFTTPFSYVTLWGLDDAAMTLLVLPDRSGGYLLDGDRARGAKVQRLDPPGIARRSLIVALEDGTTLEGASDLVEGYTLPICGEPWRGHFVSVRLGDMRFHGNINDFMPHRFTYPGAA